MENSVYPSVKVPQPYSLFQIRQGTVVIVCHTFFNHASAGSFILDETARTDAILARAGEFEGLNLARFDVTVNAPATNSRKSGGVMNAYKLSVSFTDATPNSFAQKR